MVDKKNLNRVKGILSAKNGTEIPKYNNGAKFAMYGGNNTFIYSGDGVSWFTDYNLSNAYMGSMAGFKSVKVPEQSGPTQSVNQSPESVLTTSSLENSESVSTNTDPVRIESDAQIINNLTNSVSSSVLGPSQEDLNEKVMSAGINAVREKQTLRGQEAFNNYNAKGAIGQVAVSVLEAAGSAIGAKQSATDSNVTKTADALYDTASGVAENLGPYGKAVSAAMKFAGMAGDAVQEMGGGTDQQTKMDKWMDSSFFSWNIGMLNGFAGKNSDSFGIDQDTIAKVGSSYGGTVDDLNDAASKAGKKYGLFSSKARKKANAAIATAKSQQNLMGSIADAATDQRLAVQSMGEQAGLAYSLMTDGGYNQKYTYAAKHGGLLEWNPVITLNWEPQIELNWELPVFKEGGNIDIVEELEWIPEFKSGGKTEEFDVPEIEETTQKNVIPEGALHKNKHHMEHADGLTKKGIPVIDEDGEQQAEIEHSEIIFTLEVTKKLEEYYEIFYSDESSNKEKEQAAIDAGKLLVFQILENTEDRTGLIESCKKGGSLTLKTTTDDLIEEVLEWMPTVVIVEEKEAEEKPKKDSKEKSEKEKMKEAIKEVLIELLTR